MNRTRKTLFSVMCATAWILCCHASVAAPFVLWEYQAPYPDGFKVYCEPTPTKGEPLSVSVTSYALIFDLADIPGCVEQGREIEVWVRSYEGSMHSQDSRHLQLTPSPQQKTIKVSPATIKVPAAPKLIYIDWSE